MEAATMTPTRATSRVLRISCRPLAAKAVRRELECVHGPEDGERRVLEAGQCSIELAGGRYTAVACTINGRTTERLQWTDGEQE
jgi:hypothetical protein